MKIPEVFISYSHKDEDVKQAISTHLKSLEHEGILKMWDVNRIAAGDAWQKEIEEGIKKSSGFVLLLSPNFLSSTFIRETELPLILGKHKKQKAKVFPFVLDPCVSDRISELRNMQVRPENGRSLSEFEPIEKPKTIRAFISEIAQKITADYPVALSNSFNDINTVVKVGDLPKTEHELFGREEELDILNRAWKSKRNRILSIIAWGGVGKTALVNEWKKRMARDDYRGAKKVYHWSFYNQGTRDKSGVTAEPFFNDALRWFGYTGSLEIRSEEKVKVLAELICNQRTLLLLDGLEPLQYPVGQLKGNFRDNPMISFLKELAGRLDGLCVVTSRIELADLWFANNGSSISYALPNLIPEAGAHILRSKGIKATQEEFEEASADFGGHSLAIHLLGNLIKELYRGILSQRDRIEKITDETEKGGHAKRVLDSYVKWLYADGKAELEVLYTMGLFDRPVNEGVFDIIRKERISGLTTHTSKLTRQEWIYKLNRIQELGLIELNDIPFVIEIDCHPIIREYFGELLRRQFPPSWKVAHHKLYKYYEKLPDKELPDTMDEMDPLFAAIRHGCLAAVYEEVLNEIYIKRILRGSNEQYINRQLGAYSADLSCLENFYEHGLDPDSLQVTDTFRETVLNWTGFSLLSIGRLREALPLTRAGMEISQVKGDYTAASMDSAILSELYLNLGDMPKALRFGKLCIEEADAGNTDSRGRFERVSKRCVQAYNLLQAGRLEESFILFTKAEDLQKDVTPGSTYLYALRGYQFCELLLALGRSKQAMERAKYSLQICETHDVILGIALDKLTLGLALMQKTEIEGALEKASSYIDESCEALLKSERRHQIPLGLFAKVEVAKREKNFAQAWLLLDEILQMANYGEMMLHQTDYYIQSARLILQQLSHADAGEGAFQVIEYGYKKRHDRKSMTTLFNTAIAKAEKLVNATGYFRRKLEVEALKRSFTE